MAKKILAALLVICALFSFASCGGGKSVTQEAPAPTVDYTKGAISNNVYINEWANIKFELDNSVWKQGSSSDYSSYENANTECGLIAGIATEGRQLAIVFEKNPAGIYNEEEYLDNATKALTKLISGYSVGTYYKKVIAGKEYLGVDLTLTTNGVTVYQAMYTKLYDGKFIAFSVTSAKGQSELNEVLSKVTTVK